MLAFRWWRLQWQDGRPLLESLYLPQSWHTPWVEAEEAPTPEDEAGVYALAPWARARAVDLAPLALAEGAVDLSGAVVVHEDGVVRGQRARILALRLRRPDARAHLFVAGTGALMYCTCRRQHVPGVDALTFDHVERLLLDRYGVPRLPEGGAPWS